MGNSVAPAVLDSALCKSMPIHMTDIICITTYFHLSLKPMHQDSLRSPPVGHNFCGYLPSPSWRNKPQTWKLQSMPPRPVERNAKLCGIKYSYIHILYIIASRATSIMRELPGVQSQRPFVREHARQAHLVMKV